jgi:hypothetical protein
MATAKKPAATAAKTTPAQAPVEETPEVLATIPAEVEVDAKPVVKWEYKDRLYELKTGKRPLIFTIPSQHSAKTPLLYFDEEKGYQRELRYGTNQPSPFVDEQKGPVTLGRIVMRNGELRVPKENVALQQLLSLYHPYTLKGLIKEYNPEGIADVQVDYIEMELDAMNLAVDLDIDEAEAVLRAEFGSKVSTLSSKELKRDLLVFARNNPKLFLELANDDNVHLRNIGIKATELGILKLSPDQRTFTYGEGNRKLMTVPFDEHPYSALAAYFKTDEGMEVLKAIEKKI